MAVDATLIHAGPGDLWYDVSVPTSGNRLIIDASGVPTAGSPVHLGANEGATAVMVSPEVKKIEADQHSAGIDAIMVAEASSIEVILKESNLAKLKNFLSHGTFSSGTDAGLPASAQNYEEIAFGGILNVPKKSVAVISRRRDIAASPFKHIVFQLYSCYQAEVIKLEFTRAKETTYKVKFEGLVIPTRALGDQVGKIYRQT